jgi:hypothetical protein
MPKPPSFVELYGIPETAILTRVAITYVAYPNRTLFEYSLNTRSYSNRILVTQIRPSQLS